MDPGSAYDTKTQPFFPRPLRLSLPRRPLPAPHARSTPSADDDGVHARDTGTMTTILGVEGVIFDGRDLITAAAWLSARALWPDIRPDLDRTPWPAFQRAMRAALPAIRDLADAPLLLRVLWEEGGTQGARSLATAGVGRFPRE